MENTVNTKNIPLTEERFRLMAMVSPAMMWMTNENGDCSFVNQTWLDFTGFTLAQAFSQKEWHNVIHPDDKQLFTSHYSDLKSKDVITVEYRLRHADGSWRWILDRAVPVFDAENKLCGYVGSAVDITEQKQLEAREKELEHSEATIRAIVETAFTTIVTIDANGIILSVNPAVEKLFLYKPEELIGLNVNVLMPEPFHSQHDGYMSRYLNGGQPRVIGGVVGREVQGLKKNGTVFPVNLAVSEIKIDGERLFVGILTDLTEQRMNEEALIQYSQHLEELVAVQTAEVRAIVQTAINGIVTIDMQGRIEEFNPAAELMFGYQKAEVLGQNVNILMPEPYHSEHDGYLNNFMTTGIKKIIGIGREVTAQRKDGSQFPMYLAVGHTVLLTGKHIFVGFLSDISEQKRNEKRLAEAKDAAEAGARTKANFIANMSHEIRTPMNAILGFSEVVLQDANLSADSLKNVRTIFSAAKSLLGIINDVLDVSKMESGKFSLESVCFNLYNVLSDSIRTLESKAAEKDLILVFDYDATLPIRVLGDPTRLRQVVLNLLGNAIKFTPKGSVKLVVTAGEQANMLHFSIVDTGIGMTKEQVVSVFEAFSQADASTTRRFGGTGLGTSISKQIVEAMQGQIWVDSIYGEGTTFHFTANLPVATDTKGCLFEDSSIIADDYMSPRSFNILLAEDLEANATLATLRLEQQKHHVHWVKNGREAVKAFQIGGYDLILMDIQMPELDGLSATREIRALEADKFYKKFPITILALTASVLFEERNNCLNSGMNGVVNKPIDFKELFSVMEKTVPEGLGRIQHLEPLKTHTIPAVDFSPLEGVIDYKKGLQMWGNAEAYAKALKSFAKDRADDADKIAAQRDDEMQIRHITHALKGVAANLAILNIPFIAGEIEAALTLDYQEHFDNLIGVLRNSLNHVVSAIDEFELPTTTQTAQRKTFDKNAISQLLRNLYVTLEELNPDVTDPILSELNAYLEDRELAKIRLALDNFDFDEAVKQTDFLAKKFDLTLAE